MSEKLNIRQKKFAEFYVQSGNATESAIKAGYSEKYAGANSDKLLKNTNILTYIKELSDKLKDERILSARDRQVILSDIARDEEQAPADRTRAIDTLNKMTGEYLQKVELSGEVRSEKLSDVLSQLGGEGLEE